MAITQQQEQNHSSSFLLDALYCEEEKWEEEGGIVEVGTLQNSSNGTTSPYLLPLLLLEQDLFWEDEELLSLFSKEQQQQQQIRLVNQDSDGFLSLPRREAVEWMLEVNAHYGFSTFTAILAINYLDRFLSALQFQKDKPWMIQLAAVTCISLAAKVEETHVPLLLDLQVEGAKYAFEAKTIQKMELLVLSTLEWKMHPVTPLSFLDHIIRRLGLKNHLHWEFLRRCESLLLSLVADSRFVAYPPSVLATATMMHVIDQIDPSNPLDYQNQLLSVLNISKGKVNECYQLIVETSGAIINGEKIHCLKRKHDDEEIPSSPSGVIDGYFSCENSNDSWTVASSVSLSPKPLMKKNRVYEQHMPLPSLSRVFVDAIGSPH
ncbi:Cyclin-D3-1 [Ancistrocladus abbreviatus]